MPVTVLGLCACILYMEEIFKRRFIEPSREVQCVASDPV